MPKPTTNPEWATDATYDSDGEPNKDTPGPTLRANGWERFEEPGAEHLNHMLGAHGDWISYLDAQTDGVRELVQPALATSRGVFAHPHQAAPGWDAVAGQPEWVPDSTALAANDVARCHSSTGRLVWTFTAGENLPFACTVFRVRCFIKQGAAHADGNRMALTVHRINTDFEPVLVGTVSAAAGTALQNVELTGLDVDLVGTFTDVFPAGPSLGLIVTLRGGAATAPTNDLAHLCEVRFTDVIL